jgi:methyl coenzyme M reductase gamma subunit
MRILTGVHDFAHFFMMDEKELKCLKDCGQKTIIEILGFRKAMEDRYGVACDDVEF